MKDDEVKLITDLILAITERVNVIALRVEAQRLLLRERGATDDEYELTYQNLKREWDARTAMAAEQIASEHTAARIRQLLESHEGTKQ